MVNPKADNSREIGRLHNVVLVVGSLDYDTESYGDGERLEFSWEGSDEMDPVSGRGWAMIEEGQLHIHCGKAEVNWMTTSHDLNLPPTLPTLLEYSVIAQSV